MFLCRKKTSSPTQVIQPSQSPPQQHSPPAQCATQPRQNTQTNGTQQVGKYMFSYTYSCFFITVLCQIGLSAISYKIGICYVIYERCMSLYFHETVKVNVIKINTGIGSLNFA